MIIIGYPGVGKTEAAKNFPTTIDLESSECLPVKKKEKTTTISYNVTTQTATPNKEVAEIRDFETYCKIAEFLSKSGKIVFVSSHKEVQDYFCESTELVYACYPKKDIKNEWLQFLRGRYINDDSDKNYKAYERAINNFDDDIDYMSSRGFINIELSDGAFLTNILEDSFNRAEEMNVEPETEEIVETDAVEDIE